MGTSGALVAPWSPPSMVEGLGLSQLALAAAASSVGMPVCVSVCSGAKNLRWVSESMADSGTPPLSSGEGSWLWRRPRLLRREVLGLVRWCMRLFC
jgi:hypothetical protein